MVRDAILGLATQSANDVAVVVAEALAEAKAPSPPA
jgi:D-alanyl-D-alanine carboxypeptidase